jgi:hypothetical protein
MKSLKNSLNESFVNEEEKYLGYTLGNASSADDIGDVVKSLKDMKKGEVYAMKDPGLVMWIVDVKYIGKKGSEYVFQDLLSSPVRPDEFTYTKDEMESLIKEGDIHEYYG